jgi:hypothetical protein
MSADSDAFEAVQKLPGLTPGEQQYLLTVARGEGFYGLGWTAKGDTIRLSEQFGIDPNAGVGSNNWGAEQGSGSAGSFPHVDHGWMKPNEAGEPTREHWREGDTGPRVWGPYVGQYKKHRTPAEGAASVARILLKSNVKAAIAAGDLRGAVFAQKANRYFELSPEAYLTSVKRNYGILTQNLNWPVLLADPPTLPGMIANPPLAGSLSPDSPLRSSGGHSLLHRPILRFGSSGEPVEILQGLLVKNGFTVVIDGKFGSFTSAAVRAFQHTNRLVVDGIVGPKTWNGLGG